MKTIKIEKLVEDLCIGLTDWNTSDLSSNNFMAEVFINEKNRVTVETVETWFVTLEKIVKIAHENNVLVYATPIKGKIIYNFHR